MEVFLLGNGFDLHYSLPTTYASFLHTVDYLSKQISSGREITSVSQVFSDSELQKKDCTISRCVEKYGTAFDSPLDSKVINKQFRNATKNIWFSYLLHSFEIEKGWIDFEQEIKFVIQAISAAIDNTTQEQLTDCEACFYVFQDDKSINYICSQFSFFIRTPPTQAVLDNRKVLVYPVLRDYLIERPYGSHAYYIDKKAIASALYQSLRELGNMLSAYLLLFVDLPVKNLSSQKSNVNDRLLENWNWEDTHTVSFNYTHTMQTLYSGSNQSTSFIHGELQGLNESKIVLGIDDNETDEIEHLDVTFIQFKKYFQRVIYQTDLSYITFLNQMEKPDGSFYSFHLYVIGHSLDLTDREIIYDLFMRATRITVFFHNQCALENYIRNLVSIFGKRRFDSLRAKRKLVFSPIEHLNCLTLSTPCS